MTIASDFGKRVEPVREWLSLAKIIDAGGGTVYIPVRGHTFDDVLEGQVWRLVTPMFLHFTFLHIAFNVYWLLALGGMVETRLGKWKLIGLVLIFAIVGNVAQGAWSGPMFGGVSGVNYGLFGFVWMRGRYVPESGLGISPNSAVFFMLWFILGFTGSVGPIANLAHWGGLVPGLFLGYAPKLLRDLRRP